VNEGRAGAGGRKPQASARCFLWATATAALIAASACVDGAMTSSAAPGSTTPPPSAPAAPMSPAPAPLVPVPPASAACRAGAPRAVFQRLNRNEYENSVNALLGTRLSLAAELPADPLLFGFDNGEARPVSAPLLQRYLNLAAVAVSAALGDPASRAALVPCALDSDPSCGRQVLERFLPRAFRRPVMAAEIESHLGYFSLCSDNPAAGLACALEAALVSPHFLFRSELGAGPGLDAFGLASRLSFFLAARAPDAQLLALAEQDRLGDPAVIEAEVDRWLAPAAQQSGRRGFVAGFPSQWWELDGLAAAAPAPTLFPAFDEPLRSAMADEALRFFADALAENRSALTLVRSPRTFVNQRLAAHYGIAGVVGPELRAVDTTGTLRGGVLGQAAFLTVTSSSEKTSIPLRARFVLQNLLCTSLGDPPPGADEMVPAPPASAGLSNRESLELRTNRAPCGGCHAMLNPIGFGLEVFDAVGALRATDRGKPIDPSGMLPSGQRFDNTDQLAQLLAQDERFPVCLTRKLLTYALGRGLAGTCDEETVRILAEELKHDGYRLRNHVVRIAKSDLFRSVARQESP
jgi:hypothetical protein